MTFILLFSYHVISQHTNSSTATKSRWHYVTSNTGYSSLTDTNPCLRHHHLPYLPLASTIAQYYEVKHINGWHNHGKTRQTVFLCLLLVTLKQQIMITKIWDKEITISIFHYINIFVKYCKFDDGYNFSAIIKMNDYPSSTQSLCTVFWWDMHYWSLQSVACIKIHRLLNSCW